MGGAFQPVTALSEALAIEWLREAGQKAVAGRRAQLAQDEGVASS